MIYTAIDTFYLTEEQLQSSPSRKDGIDEETETTLRIYGCDLVQESGILLKLPQAAMATGQVLFHRFYCKKSFGRFDVKRVSASCIWLASKLEECPRKARQVLLVFHRMECRRENLPVKHLDLYSKKYSELKIDLIRTERHLLKEMGFICHVEHPHKFISNYLATLGAPPELRQEAWNLANDSLRTTLCVRFKSEVIACGVVYAAARRFQVALPENPPWWKVFDADKSGIDEVCRVLSHLYIRPKAEYIPVCKVAMSLTSAGKSWDSKDVSHATPVAGNTTSATKTVRIPTVPEFAGMKSAEIKKALEELKESMKSDDEMKNLSSDDRNSDRERERYVDREKLKSREHERRRDSDRPRDRDDSDRERDKAKEKSYRSKSKDSGRDSDKFRHYSSRDRDRDYYGSYASRDKGRHRRH